MVPTTPCFPVRTSAEETEVATRTLHTSSARTQRTGAFAARTKHSPTLPFEKQITHPSMEKTRKFFEVSLDANEVAEASTVVSIYGTSFLALLSSNILSLKADTCLGFRRLAPSPPPRTSGGKDTAAATLSSLCASLRKPPSPRSVPAPFR